VKHSVRIKALQKLFPNALFIHVNRAPDEVAYSLYCLRAEKAKQMNEWYGVMPKEIEKLRGLSVENQIVSQVYYTNKNLIDDLKFVDPNQFISINYAEICSSPEIVLANIENLLRSNGVSLKRKKLGEMGYKFKGSSKRSKVPTPNLERIEQHLKELFNDNER